MSAQDYDPPSGPLVVVHRDDDLLVLDKPSGLLSVPGRGDHLADCLLARAQAQYPGALLVHRLDRDTSGLIVLALNRAAQAALGQAFERRAVHKTYHALVWGAPRHQDGTIDLPMIVDWPNRPRQKICHDTGRPARTRWQVLERSGNGARVALFPHTGRSHQLRLHMAAIGHPILGDTLYAGAEAIAAAPRLCLHAHALTLPHPSTGTPFGVTSDAPF